jgi:hypothetical protein
MTKRRIFGFLVGAGTTALIQSSSAATVMVVGFVNTGDDLPIVTPISDIVERIVAISQTAILENGGRMEMQDDEVVYIINCDF